VAICRADGRTALLIEQLRESLGEEDSIGGGTIFKAVGKDELAALAVTEPNELLRAAFEATARPMLDERLSLTLTNRALARTRDLLLPRLVTGKRDISDIDLGDLLSDEAAA
jgi:type I restriction enzyme S subunit